MYMPPEDGSSIPVSNLMNVVFPAPFSPPVACGDAGKTFGYFTEFDNPTSPLSCVTIIG
jgi:hypothetical protein